MRTMLGRCGGVCAATGAAMAVSADAATRVVTSLFMSPSPEWHVVSRRRRAPAIGRPSCPASLSGARRGLPRKLLLERLHVEARALLHRRELDEGLRGLRDLLLHEHVAPELVDEPVLVVERALDPRALERVEAQIDEDRPVDLERAAQPAVRLVDEAVLEVADPHRAERRLGEVEDLVALRRPLAGDQVELVVAVEMDLVGPLAELFTLHELVRDVRVARGGDEGREPVEARDDPVLDLAGRDAPGPADDHRRAEAPFHH